jgi:hypothetical protein
MFLSRVCAGVFTVRHNHSFIPFEPLIEMANLPRSQCQIYIQSYLSVSGVAALFAPASSVRRAGYILLLVYVEFNSSFA